VYNGVPLDFSRGADGESVRREFGISPSVPLMVSVGRLGSVKGHIHYVDAAEHVLDEIPEARFLLAGSGAEEESLRREAAEHDLGDRFIFAGRRDDVADILSASDVVVVPSLYEGFGLVAVEAMAAGRPVIGTRVGGLPEVIDDGSTGILVEPASPEQLATAIIRFCNDPELRDRMGQSGQKRYRRLFTRSRMIREFASVYEQSLGGR
jgi:glycosyltransferase involved in cell wall biosynthesis